MVVALVVAGVSQMLASSITPPGRQMQLVDGASVVALVVGTWVAARETRRRMPFCVFGTLGGFLFMDLFLDDATRLAGLNAPLWVPIVPFAGFMAGGAVACSAIASFRWSLIDRRAGAGR